MIVMPEGPKRGCESFLTKHSKRHSVLQAYGNHRAKASEAPSTRLASRVQIHKSLDNRYSVVVMYNTTSDRI
jgi:hypothetical protein